MAMAEDPIERRLAVGVDILSERVTAFSLDGEPPVLSLCFANGAKLTVVAATNSVGVAVLVVGLDQLVER